jgi:flagellar motor switch protein FliN/FliY
MEMDGDLDGEHVDSSESLSLLFGVPLTVMAKLGQRRMSVREILSLTPNSIIELDRPAGMPIDIFANEKLIARGEIVVVNEVFGVRISELVSEDF